MRTRTKYQLLKECLIQFDHIKDTAEIDELNTTISLKEEIIRALNIDSVVGKSEQLADHQCKYHVNADWTKLKCECGKEQLPKG